MIDSNKTETKHTWKIPFSWIIPVVLVIALSLLFLRSSIPTVYVSRAENKTAQDIVFGTVEIKEHHLLQVKAERGGIIAKTFIQVGERIKKGDTILSLDMQEIDLDIEKLNLDKNHLEKIIKLPLRIDSQIYKSQQDLEIMEDKFKVGQIPEDEIIESRRDLEQLLEKKKEELLEQQLDIKSSENEIERQNYSLERMELKSPIDGTVVDRFCYKGDLLPQGATAVTLIDDRRLIIGTVSESDYEKIKVGLPFELRLKAYPDQVFKGTVSQILPMADPEAHTAEVYLDADIPESKIFPGLTGEVSIIADQRENSVVVPSQAVYENRVLVVDGNRVRWQDVKTGFIGLLEIEILEGINDGDIVVTESSNIYEDDQLVKIEWE